METKELEIIKFINNHHDWKDLLTKDPYNLDVKEDDGFVLLKYDQLNSDFNEPLVKECRGIILDGDNQIVCFPFFKFFNYGEVYADKIDWSTARVQQKIDGSIMKLWFYKDKWRLSTNGSVDAYKSHLPDNFIKVETDIKSFGELFESAVNYKDLDYSKLDKDCTYIFELTSPFNKVVIYYPETTISHIGTRNNKTGQEFNVDIGVKKPKEYPIVNFNDCIKAAKELPSDEEGFVVVDANWNRIKVKNPMYLQLHRMIENNNLSLKSALNMLLENDQDEFLTYFPEYKEYFENLKNKIENLKNKISQTAKELSVYLQTSRKEYAQKVMERDKDNSYYYFLLINDRNAKVLDYLRKLPLDRLIEKLEK